ncbi:hypothetical protein BC629DRAFT_66135 [Irpex lacteus]|nr:hypothetical protein BC629DRAFT_66135 [Irpex lacteus]
MDYENPKEKVQSGYSYPSGEPDGSPFVSTTAAGRQDILYAPPSGPPPTYYTKNSAGQYQGYSEHSLLYQEDCYAKENHKSQPHAVENYMQQLVHLPPTGSSLDVPTSDASRSSSSASTHGLKSKFMGNTASDIFESPPPGFSRPPPHNDLMYAPFPVFSHISAESSLEKGFPSLIPPSSCQPHPFIVHDVRQEDWERLLNDIKVVSKLSGMDKVISNVAPMVMGVGFLGGMFVTSVMEKGMKKKKVIVVSDIIDHWNHYFFHPRWMEVTLSQGHVVHVGASGSSPDMLNVRTSSHDQLNVARYHSDHESSFDEQSMGRLGRKAGRLGMRSGIRQDRRERIEARRERREEDKETSKEKWRLTISFRPQPSM